jgi:hypothetical protein
MSKHWNSGNTIAPVLENSVQGTCGPQRCRLNRMEFPMSIKPGLLLLPLAALAVTGTIATTTTQAEAKPYGWGWASKLASSAPPSSAPRSPPATTVTTTTAIAAAAGSASTTRAAISWAASVPATEIDGMVVDSASDTGASSTPCRTPRPARLSPRAGHLFEGWATGRSPLLQDCHAAMRLNGNAQPSCCYCELFAIGVSNAVWLP